VVPTVPEPFLKNKCTLNRDANPVAVPSYIHRRQGKRFLKSHFLPCATGTFFQAGKRSLTPPLALRKQRQSDE
jgi:hypothetical protein